MDDATQARLEQIRAHQHAGTLIHHWNWDTGRADDDVRVLLTVIDALRAAQAQAAPVLAAVGALQVAPSGSVWAALDDLHAAYAAWRAAREG